MNAMRQEYPRPSLVRKAWQNLNGTWEFEIDHGNTGKEREFFKRDHLNMEINVPFAPESKLSGIEYLDFMQAVWYRRDIELTEEQLGETVLLNFGAVDYLAEVYVNGKLAGKHQGGYTPFSVDITKFAVTGKNSICVYAFDDTRSRLQPTGKQSYNYNNFSCFYTRQTGIWQTVWLEFLPKNYVTNIRLLPDVDNAKVDIVAFVNKSQKGEMKFIVTFEGKPVATKTAKFDGESLRTSIDIENPVLWDIDKPNLYDVKVEFGEDEFVTYFGMRKIAINGIKVELNGRSIFQRLVLDQGYYPDGIYTAPNVEDIKNDILLGKAAGFNGARLHMKVFEPYAIYYADHLGYLIWDEYPAWGLDVWKKESLEVMLLEWLEQVKRDISSPAIIGWCPFNELGQGGLQLRDARVLETVYEATKAIDPTRPVIDTSGYLHHKTDIYDIHDYEQNLDVFKSFYSELQQENTTYNRVSSYNRATLLYDGKTPYFVSEFGGTMWNIDDNEEAGWGYGENIKEKQDFYDRFEGLCTTLLQNPGICAYCYTQLTDVFQEKNGIYSFTRKQKFDLERLKKIQSQKAAIED